MDVFRTNFSDMLKRIENLIRMDQGYNKKKKLIVTYIVRRWIIMIKKSNFMPICTQKEIISLFS